MIKYSDLTAITVGLLFFVAFVGFTEHSAMGFVGGTPGDGHRASSQEAPKSAPSSAPSDSTGEDNLASAMVYYNNCNFSIALKYFNLIVEAKPDAEVYYLRGYALYELGRFDEAGESFYEAYFLKPELKIAANTASLLPKGLKHRRFKHKTR